MPLNIVLALGERVLVTLPSGKQIVVSAEADRARVTLGDTPFALFQENRINEPDRQRWEVSYPNIPALRG